MAEVSPREAEVLSALMTGDRVHTIAGKLHNSQHTVRNHLKSLFRKLDVTSQAELMERVRRLATET
jgi:DNA-binding NarL/FixJ family response regulator